MRFCARLLVVLPVLGLLFSSPVGTLAQCSYGAQCGRTIYEESAKQREHDQYISLQSRSYSSSSSRSSYGSVPSYVVKIPPARNYLKEQQEWENRRYRSGTSERTSAPPPTQRDYFEMVRRQAADHVVGAKDKLALAHYWGDGTTVNKPEALRLWKELAATDAEAEMTAAGMLYGGDGVPKNEAEALTMARDAAQRGSARAKTFLAGSVDTPESVQKESAAGNYVPTARYGWNLLHGTNGYAKDEGKGLAYIKQAAAAGEPHAETYLGFAYMFGDGTAVNNPEATKWFLKAAADKQDVAAYQLAWLYVEGDRPGGRDVAEARRWSDAALAKAPEDPRNIYQRGSIELSAKNEVKARALFVKAGEMNDPTALGQGAIMEWRGDGGPADFDAGYKHMLASAKAGEPVSMYELGNAYQKGSYGLEKDPVRATEFFQKAADKGVMQAQHNMAMAYYRGGRGVPQDYAKAAEYIQKAIDNGDSNGMYMLAVMYQEGTGVAKDAASSLAWMKKAAAAGDANAKQDLASGFSGR